MNLSPLHINEEKGFFMAKHTLKTKKVSYSNRTTSYTYIVLTPFKHRLIEV